MLDYNSFEYNMFVRQLLALAGGYCANKWSIELWVTITSNHLNHFEFSLNKWFSIVDIIVNILCWYGVFNSVQDCLFWIGSLCVVMILEKIAFGNLFQENGTSHDVYRVGRTEISHCLVVVQLNPVISSRQGKLVRNSGSSKKKADSKWMKDKFKGNGF